MSADERSAHEQLTEIADDISCGATGASDLVAKAMELIDERDSQVCQLADERDAARTELEPHRRALTFLTEVITGAALIGADDAIGMIRELVPVLVDVDALTADQAARVKDGLAAQQAERDRLAEQVQRATDVRLIRFAISDPGAFVKRERFNQGDYETVPAWGARAVVLAVQNGGEQRG